VAGSTTASCPARLKSGLAATRVEEDGITYYDVLEPESGNSFRFYEHEYLLAQQLEPGRPLTEVSAWVRRELGVESRPEDLGVFIDKVRELGFLEAVKTGPAAAPAPFSGAAATPAPTPAPAPAPAPRADEKQQRAAFAAALTSAGERAEVLSVPFASGDGAGSPPEAALPQAPRPIPLEALPGVRGLARHAPPAAAVPEEITDETPLPAPLPLDATPWPAPAPAASAPAPAAPAAPANPAAPATSKPPVAAPRAVPPPGAGIKRAPFRRGLPLLWLLVPIILLGVAVGLFIALQQPRAVAAAETPVRLVDVHLQAVTRYHGETRMTAPEPSLLAFKEGGPVRLVLPAGKRVEAGEVLAKLEGADRFQRDLEHAREREAFYRLKLETASAAHEKGTIRLAERKVEEKQRLVEGFSKAWAARVVTSPTAGILVAALVKAGDVTKPDQPVVKFVPLKLRAEFDVQPAAGSAFRPGQTVELVTAAGRAFQSHIDATEPRGARVRVLVTAEPNDGGKEGDPVRLVRAKFEQVARIPLTAIARRPGGEVAYVLVQDAAGPKVQARPVVVVDRDGQDALVAQGLRRGDRVVASGVEALADGQRIRPIQ
jgi:multidrug efflux pump subunit AcrA (membrane-fusion protein)